MPFLGKGDLRAAYPFGMLAVPREEVASYHESSGTSGEPTPSFFTEADWDDIVERFGRNAVAVRRGDVVLIKTPYSLVTTAHQMHRMARAKGALVVPADNRSTNIPYSKVVRLLRDLEITVAWCMPTEALLWAEAARCAGLDPATDFPRLRAFLVAGEPLTQAKRRCIERIWTGAKVFQDYGSTETGSLAGECAFHSLHFWADRVYAEIVDTHTGKSAPRGIGELVVTPLFRQAMPLIRYRLEDRVELSDESCPCGSHLPKLRVRGREQSRYFVQGQSFFPSELESLVYALPAEARVWFWRARASDSGLEIEIEVEGEHAPTARRLLADRVRLQLNLTADVRAVAPGKVLPRERLVERTLFQKPRFVFTKEEDWSHAIQY
jgi:phenylacetate-CoA ligase